MFKPQQRQSFLSFIAITKKNSLSLPRFLKKHILSLWLRQASTMNNNNKRT